MRLCLLVLARNALLFCAIDLRFIPTFRCAPFSQLLIDRVVLPTQPVERRVRRAL